MSRSLVTAHAPSRHQPLTPDQRNTFLAALLGWTMDAFDYLLVVMVLTDIAQDSAFRGGVPEARFAVEVGFITTVTLMTRPVGALIFGLWADRVGRRIPLIVDVLLYSVCGVLCAIAPNLTALLVLRFCYGIGMGGEWGLGAALLMEKIPPSRRGLFSGMLQVGYSLGYLLAALAYLLIHSVLHLDWRWIFVLCIIPALISLLVRYRVRESEVWEATREQMRTTRTSIKDVLLNRHVIRQFGYLILLMTAFSWMSNGISQIYPQFLRATHQGGAALSATTASWIMVLYSIGGIAGGVIAGGLTDRFGRRYIMIACAVLVLPLMLMLAFGRHDIGMLALGSFLVQVMVQGAWAAIPAYLTEMSPDAIRGSYPGVTYQVGNLLSSISLPVQVALAAHHGYSFALTATVIPALVAVVVLTAVAPEAKGIRFGVAPLVPGL